MRGRATIWFFAAILGGAVQGSACRADHVTGVKGSANQWHQWRGPSGQGYSDDTHVPLTWSETENLLWKTPLPGRGNSTPIIWGDRVFLTAASKDGKERFVLCLRATDGKVLWQQLAAKDPNPEKLHEWNTYASPSCTTDGSHVYAFFGTPGLFCYDMDGKLVWQHRFGIFTSEAGWGTAASPFLFEDLVIQNCDNDGAAALPRGHKAEEAAPMALVALDKNSGKVRWQTPRDQGRGFSTPRLIQTPQGRIDLVLNGPLGVWGYDPRTGKELWHVERTAPGDSSRFGEPMPVSDGEVIFAGSGRPGPFQAIRMGANGDATKSHLLWQVVKKDRRDVGSPILWGGLIYAVDRGGMLTCHDAKNGELLYTQRLGSRDNCLASSIALRGKLLFLLDSGKTIVVEPGRSFKEVGQNNLGDGHALDFGASPAVVDGRLFLRSQTHLYCIGEKRN